MDSTDQCFPTCAPRRCTGIVARLYGPGRYGVIVSFQGERLMFWRRNVIDNANRWTPDVGEAVMFDRILERRGLKAFKVRPVHATSRHRVPADGA